MSPHRASAIFIFVTIGLDALGAGVVVPVLPGLVMRAGHIAAAAASFWMGAILTAYSMMQFAAAPVLGGLSDRFGRRPVLLVSLVALAISMVLMAQARSLLALLLIRLFAGAVSGNTAAATAYIADVTPPAQRAAGFGMVGALYGLGFVLGPALGGVLGAAGPRLPFYVSAALAAANAAYGFLVLPESLPPQRRRGFSWRRANPFGTFGVVFANAATLRLGVAWCCVWFAIGAQQSSFILANEMRFHWNTMQNGLVLALAGIASAGTQSLLVGRTVAWLGPAGTALLGMACLTLGYLGYAFAFTRWIMFPAVLILALGALCNPAVQSMLSTAAGPQRQGEVQGGLEALQGLMAGCGPLLMGWLFEQATRHAAHFIGAPFLLAAAICMVGFFALWSGRLALNRPADQSET